MHAKPNSFGICLLEPVGGEEEGSAQIRNHTNNNQRWEIKNTTIIPAFMARSGNGVRGQRAASAKSWGLLVYRMSWKCWKASFSSGARVSR